MRSVTAAVTWAMCLMTQHFSIPNCVPVNIPKPKLYLVLVWWTAVLSSNVTLTRWSEEISTSTDSPMKSETRYYSLTTSSQASGDSALTQKPGKERLTSTHSQPLECH